MTYPSIHEVEFATRHDLAKWYRFLPSPESTEKVKVMDRIYDRFHELGGMTAEISKSIGWDTSEPRYVSEGD